jgi:hypothetical protein
MLVAGNSLVIPLATFAIAYAGAGVAALLLKKDFHREA